MRLSPACLRIGTVRLALALILGLLAISGYVVAPQLFAHAGSRQLAGELAGGVFHLANQGSLLLAFAVAAFWWRMGVRAWPGWLALVLVALAVAFNEYVVTARIVELKVQVAGIDTLAADDPLRRAFGRWHGISAGVHLLATLAAAWLVASAPQERRDCKGSSTG